MFTNLINLEFTRTGKQAIGFYLAFLFLGMILGGLSAGVYALITEQNSFSAGAKVGNLVAIAFTLGISSAIVIKKKILSFKTIALILLSGFFAVILGCIGGLIPAAYLSTLSHKASSNMDA